MTLSRPVLAMRCRAAWRAYSVRCALVVLGLGVALTATAGRVAMAQDAHPAAAIGWLSVESSSSGALFVGHVLGLSKGQIDATMTLSRHGKAGVARSTQSDHVSLEPGVTAALSRTTLSLQPGDRLTAELKLSQGGRTISTSRIEIGN